MKQLLFSILFVILFIACDNNSEYPAIEEPVDLTELKIKGRPCETLEYVGKIGNDFNSALESLRSLKNIPLSILIDTLEVLFDHDDREFYGIVYLSIAMFPSQSMVLDTKGNYYWIKYHCPDETGWKVESIVIGNERKSVPSDNIFREDAYVLTFENDSIFYLPTSVNAAGGKYKIVSDDGNIIINEYHEWTKVGTILEDQQKFNDQLLSVFNGVMSYSYTGNKLILKGEQNKEIVFVKQDEN